MTCYAAHAADADPHASTATVTQSASTSMVLSAVKSSTGTVPAPDPAQVEKINQSMRLLRAPDSAEWPRAASNIHTLDPRLAVPQSVTNRLLRAAWTPAEKERTRNGWITTCETQNNALDAIAAFGMQAHSTLPYLIRLSHRVCIHDHLVQAIAQLGAPDNDQLVLIANGLNDKDPEARQAAVEYLAAEKMTPEILHALARAMNDANSGVRLSALQALEGIHPEGEGRLPTLAPFLKDPSSEIRERALYMVGQLGADAHSAIPLLHEALHDSDPSIALESARYLAKIDSQDEALLTTLISFIRKNESGMAPQAAELLQSLNVHEARIDNALEPYRKEESFKLMMDKSSTGITPERLAENARTLKVQHFKIASRIVQNQPVDTQKVYRNDIGRLYCWTEVEVSSPPAAVNYRWFRDGHLQQEDTLEVVSSTQTLWSTAVVHSGHWKVDVVPAGATEPLVTAVFVVAKHHEP